MPKSKFDNQITQMAGEFLAVGKLFKRGYQASLTLGNAKAVDILAFNPRTDRSFAVEVKTLREPNCFPIVKEAIHADHVYIFIFLHEFEIPEEFFIVPGCDLLADIDKYFGSSYRYPARPSAMPAINYGPLKFYRDNWKIFDAAKTV